MREDSSSALCTMTVQADYKNKKNKKNKNDDSNDDDNNK